MESTNIECTTLQYIYIYIYIEKKEKSRVETRA